MTLAVLTAVALLFLAVSCGTSDDAASPDADDAPPSRSPTEILSQSAADVSQLKSLSFTLTHETGNIPLMMGMVGNEISGLVSIPDEASPESSVNVKGEMADFAVYMEISVIRQGDAYYYLNPLTQNWQDIDQSLVPFDLTDVAAELAEIMGAMTDVSFVGDGSSEDSWQISGKVLSQELCCIFDAAEGYEVNLEIMIRNIEGIGLMPERSRIQGRVVESDAENYVRILTLGDFNEPVTIETPPIP